MGFFGSGAPVIKLLDEAGTVFKTATLPHPVKGGRSFTWESEGDPTTNPLTGNLMAREFGVRPVLRLRYEGDVSSTVEDLTDIRNSGLKILVKPYSDTEIYFFAIVTVFKNGHKDGNVNLDSVEIEFTGTERKKNVPSLDTFYTVSQRKGII